VDGHTAASLPVAGGVNVKAVQRMLGHASATITLDVCSGLFDDDLGARAGHMDAAHDARQTSRTVSTVWARDPAVTIGNQESSR
jgi:integrase